MASTKEKMQQAQQLIKEKRYDEARAILRTVNHDKAYEWLDKLDKIAPEKVVGSPKLKTGKSWKRRLAEIAGGAIALLCLCSVIASLGDNNNSETVIPTSINLPTATDSPIPNTPNPTNEPVATVGMTDSGVSPDVGILTFRDNVSLHIDGVMVVEYPARYFALEEVGFVLLGEIENTSSRRECLYARDIRLTLDGEEYAPNASLMDMLKAEIGREFTGAFNGHCVEAGQRALTFAAFDVPMAASNASLRFREDAQQLEVPWHLDAYTKTELMRFDELPVIATEYFIVAGTQSAAATMTATLWTQTSTATITPTSTNDPSMITLEAMLTEIVLTENAPTAIPTLTPIPGPEDMALAAFIAAVGSYRVDDIETLVVNDIVVTIRFPLSDIGEWSMRREIEDLFPELVCELREAGLTGRTYQLTGTIGLVDSFGNTSRGEGVEMIIPAANVARLNCDESAIYNIDLSVVAERYDVHPALRQ